MKDIPLRLLCLHIEQVAPPSSSSTPPRPPSVLLQSELAFLSWWRWPGPQLMRGKTTSHFVNKSSPYRKFESSGM